MAVNNLPNQNKGNISNDEKKLTSKATRGRDWETSLPSNLMLLYNAKMKTQFYHFWYFFLLIDLT